MGIFRAIFTLFWYFFIFFGGFGVREWSKMTPGTRTIIFSVPKCHIEYSRPISGHFLRFLDSPEPVVWLQDIVVSLQHLLQPYKEGPDSS